MCGLVDCCAHSVRFLLCVWVAVLVMMSNVLCRFHNEGVVLSMEYIILPAIKITNIDKF